MHGLNEGSHVVGVHVRVDAVSEVRDPAFSSEPFGHLFDHLVDALRRSVEGAGVEVTLKRDVVADELPAGLGVDRPIEANDLISDVSQGGQSVVAPLCKNHLEKRTFYVAFNVSYFQKRVFRGLFFFNFVVSTICRNNCSTIRPDWTKKNFASLGPLNLTPGKFRLAFYVYLRLSF